MSRYIDADAMDKRRIDYIVDGYAESVADMTEWGMALIEAPAIGIVRCKECKEWNEYARDKKGRCDCHLITTSGEDFCSYGERKE